ncbi:DUF2867 domain-containing protein [Roseobacter weihaiensis]|uniref:DUF2867 domain-containing protein n=1 Tax=Roseobacter weihaiensis TaxID=2763262 RepID=UPI001D0AD510|nr:DUF2867 domain-containing protein [Roseobacter sp. H9]
MSYAAPPHYNVVMICLADSNVRVLEAVETLDYFDSQTVQLARHIAPLDAWNLIMEDPQSMLRLAFRVRDMVSSLFGVKSIGGFSGNPAKAVTVGDHLDFFLVEYVDSDTLVLTERDRHLDVMTCISTDGPSISITSSVRVHNRFGQAYMIPVGIAHKSIVRNMLNQLRRKLSD